MRHGQNNSNSKMPDGLVLFREQRDSRMDVAKRWAIRTVIGVLFVFIGRSKFADHSEWVRVFAQIGLGQWFRYFTGILQILGGILVLIPRTFAVGILILASTMLGAAAFWILIGGEPLFAMIPTAILMALLFCGGEQLIDLADRLRKN